VRIEFDISALLAGGFDVHIGMLLAMHVGHSSHMSSLRVQLNSCCFAERGYLAKQVVCDIGPD